MKRLALSVALGVTVFVYSFFYLSAASSDSPTAFSRLLIVLLLVMLGLITPLGAFLAHVRFRVPLFLYPIAFVLLVLALNVYAVADYTTASYATAHALSLIVSMGLFILRAVLLYGGMTIVALLIGDGVLRHAVRGATTEWYWSTALATGLITIALYVYLLAFASLLYPWLVLPPIIFAAANREGVRRLFSLLKKFVHRLRHDSVDCISYENLFFSSLVVIAAYAFIKASFPLVVNGDSLLHYFTVPQLMLANHGFVDFPFWPLGTSLLAFAYLYIPLLAVDASLINFVALYFFIISIPPLFFIARNYLSQKNAWLVPWLYLMVPLNIHFLLLNPRIDYLNIYFLIVGFLVLIPACAKRSLSSIGLAALLFAYGFSVKFTSFFMIPGVVLFAIMELLKLHVSKKTLLKYFFVFSFVMVSSLGLWNLRPYLTTGDFFYRYSRQAGNRYYAYLAESKDDMVILDRIYDESFFYETMLGYNQPFPEYVRNFFSSAIVNAWFNVGPLLFLMMTASCLLLRDRRVRAFAFLILSSIILWYFTIPVMGYYLDFLFPFGALLAAIACAAAYPWARRYVLMLVALLMVVNISATDIGRHVLLINGILPMERVGEIAQPYALTRELNGIIDQDPSAVFLSVDSEPFVMHDSNKHRFDELPVFYLALAFAKTHSRDEARSYMKQTGITHLIYSDKSMWAQALLDRCHKRGGSCAGYELMLQKIDDVVSDLRPVIEKGPYRIYAL